jgi:hypothetical protein
MKESDVRLATIRAISENQTAILILRALNRVNDPLRISEISGISGLPYGTTYLEVWRLEQAKIVSIFNALYNTRNIYIQVVDREVVQQILDYHDKQKKQLAERQPSQNRISELPEEV